MPSFLGCQGRDSFDDKTPFPGAKARMTHCVGAVFLKPWRHVSLTRSVFFVLTRCRTVLKLHFSRAVPPSYLGCWLLGYSPQCGSNKAFFLSFFFFRCGPFLKYLLNLLQCCFCFMFWFLGPKARRILAPWPAPPVLEGQVLITGSPGKSPNLYSYYRLLIDSFQGQCQPTCTG